MGGLWPVCVAALALAAPTDAARKAAASCCAGTFVAQGRGGTYPPGGAGEAFDFVVSNDNQTFRFAQRAKDPTVHVGNVNLPSVNGQGGGHWFWTNSSNCFKLPNPQPMPNLCFGAGHIFSVDKGTVTMAGVTVQRWSDGPSSPHIFYTLPPTTASSHCDMVLEQGFGVGMESLGMGTLGTPDDAAVYWNVEHRTPEPQAFEVPSFCPP